MKLLEEKPGVKITCHGCTSVFSIDETDVTARIDVICGQVNTGAPDLTAELPDCPVCGTRNSRWLYELPGQWREGILARSQPLVTRIPVDAARAAKRAELIAQRDGLYAELDKLIQNPLSP